MCIPLFLNVKELLEWHNEQWHNRGHNFVPQAREIAKLTFYQFIDRIIAAVFISSIFMYRNLMNVKIKNNVIVLT